MAKMGRKRIDMTGEKYGYWTCIEPRPNGKWLCRCECGTVKEVARKNLLSGISTSCGCKFHRGVHANAFPGCDEDCFNCPFEECERPDYLCGKLPEVEAW